MASADQPAALAWSCAASDQRIEATVVMDAPGEVTIRPGPGMAGVIVATDLEYAVLPSRWVQSVNYFPENYAPGETIYIPPESLIMGLGANGNRSVVLAWPTAGQSVCATRNAKAGADSRFDKIRVMLDGRELHIGLFDAPGIWGRIALGGRPLDQDISIDWKPPFRARWITEMIEFIEGQEIPRAYQFENKKTEKEYRPCVGFFQQPAWLDAGGAGIHLSTTVPPKGVALIYALEGNPKTPFEFLARALPVEEQKSLVELGKYTECLGNPLTPRPPPVWRLDCLGTDWMLATFLTVGAQSRERQFMMDHANDRRRVNTLTERCNQRHMDLVRELREEADQWEAAGKDRSELLAYLGSMHLV